jgi:PAS domain S-box-containing protein
LSRIWGKAATLDAPQQVGIDSKQHPLLFSDGVPGIMTDSHEASQDGPEQGCDWSGAADNELLAAILHGAAEAVIAIDQAQNISLFNEGAERIFGYRAEEVIGEPLSLLLPQRFRRGHKTAIREFGQNPVGARLMGQRGEIAGLRKDGTEFPAEASIIHLPHGQRYGFAAILRDVSERHEAAQALRKSEETHRQLADLLGTVLDALPANIAVLDESGKIIRVNESWARFVLQNGYRQPDLGVGRDYQEVCEAATGISAEGAREVGQKLQQVLNGQSLGFTTDYPCHAPAAKRWFQVLAAPTMGAAGTGAVVMHIDITERKQATAALATERHLLELVASDQPLSEILEELCQTVEQQAPSSICTVLGADSFSRRLKFFAGRNFPEAFRERISGLLVGEAPYPCARPCGPAGKSGLQTPPKRGRGRNSAK